MSLFSAFRYDGKRALVVGGASGMGAAVAELVQDAGAEVVVMDFAEVTLPGAKAIHVNLGEQGVDRRRGRRVRRSGRRAVLVRGRRRRHAEHREDQLHRAPVHDRPAAGAAACSARGSAIGFISSAAGPRVGSEPPAAERVPRHHRLRRRGAVGAGARQGRLHVEQAGDLRVRRARGDVAPASRASASTRSAPARPTRRSRRRTRSMWLGFGADYRAEVGVEAATPLEQAYPLVFLCSDAAGAITGHDDDHRLRLLQRRRDRGVPGGNADRELPPRQVLVACSPTTRCSSRSTTT